MFIAIGKKVPIVEHATSFLSEACDVTPVLLRFMFLNL